MNYNFTDRVRKVLAMAREEAIRLDETFTPAYLALHDAYRLMGQFDKADEVLAQMLTKARPAWAPRMPVW